MIFRSCRNSFFDALRPQSKMTMWTMTLPSLRSIATSNQQDNISEQEQVDPLLLEPSSFSKTFPPSLSREFQHLSLLESWCCAKDHKILRFSLPKEARDISLLGVPSGVKVRQTISNEVLDKSYSPISHPTALGYLDLLVKRYPFRQGGGLGDWLYRMQPGDEIEIKLKPEKLFAGTPYYSNRWKHLVLIGNGTGVAPLYQLALSILNDPKDVTKVWYVSQHSSSNEILLEDELQAMREKHANQFSYHVMLTCPQHPDQAESSTTMTCGHGAGRLGMDEVQNINIFPSPKKDLLEDLLKRDVHAIVCGTDGFLETVCGSHIRVKIPGKIKKKKIQGPLSGLLKEAGWTKEQVSKL